MQIGKYYRSKLSGLTFRYKGFFIGVNMLDDDVNLYAEEVFKVMEDRASYKTERPFDVHVSFREKPDLVVTFTNELQMIMEKYQKLLAPVEDAAGQAMLPFVDHPEDNKPA